MTDDDLRLVLMTNYALEDLYYRHDRIGKHAKDDATRLYAEQVKRKIEAEFAVRQANGQKANERRITR